MGVPSSPGEGELAVVVEVVLVAEEDHLVLEQGVVDRLDGRRGRDRRRGARRRSGRRCSRRASRSTGELAMAPLPHGPAGRDQRFGCRRFELRTVASNRRIGRASVVGQGDRDVLASDTDGGDHRRRNVGHLHGGKLQDAGIDTFTIFEKADEVGGTWRDNTYPGLHCDVPSRYYSYSFRPNPEWSRLLPPGPEIQAYFRSVADRTRHPLRTSGSAPRSRRAAYRDGQWWLTTAGGRGSHSTSSSPRPVCCGCRGIPTSPASTPSPVRRSTRRAGITRFRCRTSGSG